VKPEAIRVLAIDDEPSVLLLCELNLGFAGMDVVVCQDGEEGLDVAVREQPDVIVLDRMMPNVDGITVLRELKRHAATARIPVVMLTARALRSDRLESWIAGASAHISKPFSLDELTETVTRLVHMSPAERDAHRADILTRLRELA
jgi:DNA-binding response OmpR family regulator